MESEKQTQMVRIVTDAVVGAGMVLREGQVVPADVFGSHLEPLLRTGAVEWAYAENRSVSLM